MLMQIIVQQIVTAITTDNNLVTPIATKENKNGINWSFNTRIYFKLTLG